MTAQMMAKKTGAAGAGALLLLGAGLLAATPAQAEAATSGEKAGVATASAHETPGPEAFTQLALVRSATEPTVYYLKAPAPGGIGEVPAPDGLYRVDIVSGDQHEQLTVTSIRGRLDLGESQILRTAPFEPHVSVSWVGQTGS